MRRCKDAHVRHTDAGIRNTRGDTCTMDTSITIYGDQVTSGRQRGGSDGDTESAEVLAMGFGWLHVSMAGEARCNGDDLAGPEHKCGDCGDILDSDTIGYAEPQSDGYGPLRGFCMQSEDDRHHAVTIPGSFANSAGVSVNDADEVTVAISVGDPRGAFTMTVWRRYDGTLMLSVPYEGMGQSHMDLKKVSEGTYQIS